MSLSEVCENADHLIPKSWRWRITAERHPADEMVTLHDPKLGARLAAIVPEHEPNPPWDADLDIVPGLGIPRSWVVADGNMVTRWYTLQDAVLYAAQARGHWDRPWPLSRLQFWGDGVRDPWRWLSSLSIIAVMGVAYGRLPLVAAAVLALLVSVAIRLVTPGPHEADYDQTDPTEVDGWPDHSRWGPLFDSTVWDPNEKSER